MKMLQCGNQQWCQTNADETAWYHKMHQLDEKWQQGNQQGCQPN
jgi:hypothetical protein